MLYKLIGVLKENSTIFFWICALICNLLEMSFTCIYYDVHLLTQVLYYGDCMTAATNVASI